MLSPALAGVEGKGEGGVITKPTSLAHRDDALSPETKHLAETLRRYAAGKTDARETDDLARMLDGEIQRMAHAQGSTLPWADRANVAQRVLSELFTGDAFRERLNDIVDADDLEFLHRVRGRLRMRVHSRSANQIRRVRRQREVDLIAAANVSISRKPRELPTLEEVLTLLSDAAALPDIDPLDRLFVVSMLCRGTGPRATARAYGVDHSFVRRAINRVSPHLRREFGLE